MLAPAPDASPTTHVYLCLLPGFPLQALGGLLEAFAAANAWLGHTRYHTHLMSESSAWVPSYTNVTVPTPLHLPTLQAALANAAEGASHQLWVLSGSPLPEQGHEELLTLLREAAERDWTLGAVGTGTVLLARAGTLQGHRATLPLDYGVWLAERFADTVVSEQLYECHEKRLTCGVGAAATDLVLAWLTEQHGPDILLPLLAALGLDRLRSAQDSQRPPLVNRIGGGQPKLSEAVNLMAANVQEPLSTEDVAQLVGVSRRQLERLFKQHLDTLPSRYYLELRLQRARTLLQQTNQSILQIGLACGFSSGPHFSSAYRQQFGITPREQRSQRVAARWGLRAAPPPVPPSSLSDPQVEPT